MRWHSRQLRSELPPRFAAADLPLHLRFGGHDVTLRWLEPDDTGRLIELFAAHCEESVEHPSIPAVTRMSPAQAERWVTIEHQHDAALGVFEEIGREPRLIGIGRYWLRDDGRSAEASFVVHEQRRGIGIATALLQALIAIAGERQVAQLTAQVRTDNGPMIHVLRTAGATFRRVPDSNRFESVLRVPGAEYGKTPAVPPKRNASAWLRSVPARTALQFERMSETLLRLPTP